MATKVRRRSVGMLVSPVVADSLPPSDSITSPLRWRPLRIRPAPLLPGHCEVPMLGSRAAPAICTRAARSPVPTTDAASSYRNFEFKKHKRALVLAHYGRASFLDDLTKGRPNHRILKGACVARRPTPRSSV